MVLAISITIWFAVGFAGFALIGIGFFIVTGWLPILMCATDYAMDIGSPGLIGQWALYSVYAYSAASIVLIGMMVLRPDPDGLPPAWKFLALFYKYETVNIVNSAASGKTFESGSFFKAAGKQAKSTFKSLDETRKLKAANKKLDAEAKRIEESKKSAETAMKIELLKAEEAELRKQRELLEKETKKRRWVNQCEQNPA